jgi:hypothetical protein
VQVSFFCHCDRSEDPQFLAKRGSFFRGIPSSARDDATTVVQNALAVVQDALAIVQDALAVVQDALAVVQNALAVM